MSKPWMKFYPSDWRSDPALRMCSLAARGLWMEMLCVMHEATPRGHLLVNGRAINERQLAGLVGCSQDELQSLLDELRDAGVFDLADDVIVSRRMVRDEDKANMDKANGSKGGNPKITRVNGGVNPPHNPQHNPSVDRGDKAQKPDTRYQIEGSNEPSNARAPDAIQSEFSQTFWPAYPHKVGKPDAEKKFRAARKVASLEQIMAGLHRYIASKPPDRQWCNPSTWLHQHRWADQPAAEPIPFARPTTNAGASNAAIQHILNRHAAREPVGAIEVLPPVRSGY